MAEMKPPPLPTQSGRANEALELRHGRDSNPCHRRLLHPGFVVPDRRRLELSQVSFSKPLGNLITLDRQIVDGLPLLLRRHSWAVVDLPDPRANLAHATGCPVERNSCSQFAAVVGHQLIHLFNPSLLAVLADG